MDVVPAKKIAKSSSRAKALGAAGDHVLLFRVCKYGNNKHKKKYSTAVCSILHASSTWECFMLRALYPLLCARCICSPCADHSYWPRAVSRVAEPDRQDQDRYLDLEGRNRRQATRQGEEDHRVKLYAALPCWNAIFQEYMSAKVHTHTHMRNSIIAIDMSVGFPVQMQVKVVWVSPLWRGCFTMTMGRTMGTPRRSGRSRLAGGTW